MATIQEFEYGYSYVLEDGEYAIKRNGQDCTTALGRPVTRKTAKAAASYIEKCISQHKADAQVSDEQRQQMRQEREAKESAEKASRDAAFKEKLERERSVKEARRERYTTNELLRGRGYHWKKWQNDEEDIDLLRLPEYEWILYSPDGREVSVKEAMQELAWQGVSFAKEWLAGRNIAEEMPVIEKQRRSKSAQQAKEEQQETFDDEQIAYRQEAVQVLVNAGLTKVDANNIADRWSQPHSPKEGVILIGQSMMLNDARQVMLAMNDDLRYGVLINSIWHGIDEVLQYPDLPQDFVQILQQKKAMNEWKHRNLLRF